MADKIFVKGMIAKKPHERAPDFVIANVSIKVEEFAAFMEDHKKPDGWLNIGIKESKGGKFYAELDTWEKGKKEDGEPAPSTAEEQVEAEIRAEDIPY